MAADLANNAAAVAEGYSRVQTDRGATANPRFVSRYEKLVDGDLQSGTQIVAEGTDNVSQANADTVALNALNGRRRHIYGSDATNVNKGPRSQANLTVGRH